MQPRFDRARSEDPAGDQGWPTIGDNLAAVRARLGAAAQACGRQPGEITLVAVSKLQPAEAIRVAYQAGQRDFGENYAQELRDKAAALADCPEIRWHFIGPLQRNKVKYVVPRAVLVHTVDGVALLEEIERRAAAATAGAVPAAEAPARAATAGAAAAAAWAQEVLLEVDLAGEESKAGVPEQDVPLLLDGFARFPHLRCVGLMALPPYFADPEEVRPYFRRLRELAARVAATPRPNVVLHQLSMGMSHDFEVAIGEGATLIRVGSAIFGERPTRRSP